MEVFCRNAGAIGRDFTPRKGRLHGAVWIEWYDFMDLTGQTPLFRPKEEIIRICEKKRIYPDSEIIIYCFKGSRASNTYVALKGAGFENLRIYYGSWNEWSRDFSLPIDDRILLAP